MQEKNVTKVTFSVVLSELLRQRGKNAAALSESIGISHVSVGKWLNKGAIPSADLLFKVARYFGVTMEMLLGEASTRTASRLDNGGEPELDVAGLRRDLDEIERFVASARSRLKKI